MVFIKNPINRAWLVLMIATAMAGAFAGAAFARRLPAIWLRRLVVAVGAALSLIYFIKTYA